MSEEFRFSDPGEGLQEAEIIEIHVGEGDTVGEGDVVLTLETDKANTDIPAPFTGTIDSIEIAEGDMVEIDDVLMTYSEDGASESKDPGSGDDSGRSDDDEDEKDEKDEKSHSGKSKSDKSSKGGKSKRKEKDKADSKSKRDGKTAKKTSDGDPPVPAAPSTRRLAREKGVDLRTIEPDGQNGRITAEDVEAAAESGGETAGGSKTASGSNKADSESEGGSRNGSPLAPAAGSPSLPDFSQWGETERMPLRSIRRATAENMARAWAQIPHVYHQDVADVTELERFRREHEPEQGKLTLTVLVMKALVSALKRFPRFNASLDVENREIVLKKYFHIGLAVATERGLLVPTIRDVDRKSLLELAVESENMARKTRNGEVKREDMQGGSMTLTNPGPLGGSALTPLINHPQVAILGMAQASLEPVVSGDTDNYQIQPRLHLPLVLGFDHRVNDGADAARFVTFLKETLADPESLLLNL